MDGDAEKKKERGGACKVCKIIAVLYQYKIVLLLAIFHSSWGKKTKKISRDEWRRKKAQPENQPGKIHIITHSRKAELAFLE